MMHIGCRPCANKTDLFIIKLLSGVFLFHLEISRTLICNICRKISTDRYPITLIYIVVSGTLTSEFNSLHLVSILMLTLHSLKQISVGEVSTFLQTNTERSIYSGTEFDNVYNSNGSAHCADFPNLLINSGHLWTSFDSFFFDLHH